MQFLCGLVLAERFMGTPIMLWASASLKNAHTFTWLACAGVSETDGALPAEGKVTPPVSLFVLPPLQELRSKQPKASPATATNVLTNPPHLFSNQAA
jgi:hypothetical protein